jgi:CHASE2 domain-containing sensor protein
VGQALILLVSMLILGAGSFALLLLTGVIRIKQYAPPQAGANFTLIVGIIVILSFFAMIPYAFYPAIGSLILVGLGVLATAVVFHDNKRQKQERQTDRGKSRLYKLAPKQPQPKEAREE